LLCLEQGIDIALDGGSGVEAGVTLDEVTFLVEKELLEIPGDVVPGNGCPSGHGSAVEATTGENESIHIVAAVALVITSRILGDLDGLTHPLEKRVSGSTVDVHFGEEITTELEALSGANVLKSVQNVVVILVGLVTELVAKNTQDGHIRPGGVHDVLHRGEVRRGRASQSGNILDQNDLALVGIKLHGLAAKLGKRVIVKSHVKSSAAAESADAGLNERARKSYHTQARKNC